MTALLTASPQVDDLTRQDGLEPERALGRFDDAVQVRRLVASPQQAVEARPSLHHVLTLASGGPVAVRVDSADTAYESVYHSGCVDFVPAGLSARWQFASDAEVILISLSPTALDRCARTIRPDRLGPRLVRQVQREDAQLALIASALALASEGSDTRAPSPIKQGLIYALCAKLLDIHGGPAPGPSLQKLSSQQCRRVLEYLEERLSERLSISEIAAVARLSPSHFKVLFRRTFGMPVRQYIIQRRVELAAKSIRSGAPIGEIAIAAGFAHQSHLARSMRKVLGVTPAELARQSR